MLPTDDTGRGLSPTPAVMEDGWIPNENEARTAKIKSNLNAYTIRQLPPTAQTQGPKVCQNGKSCPIDAKLLPTPTAIDAGTGRMNRSVSGGASERPTLALLVKTALPTPQATDHKRGAKAEHQQSVGRWRDSTSSQLNPRFVAEMMGFPINWTELPFRHGGENPSRPTVTQ